MILWWLRKETNNIRAYKPGNIPSENVEELLEMAEAGNVDAMLTLRDFYEMGYKVQVNPNEAFKWVHQAAMLGSASAQYSVGSAYLYGKYAPHDYEAAIAWFYKAAKQDYAEACLALSTTLNIRDYPLPIEDEEQVRFWLDKGIASYMKDAENGNSNAMFQLAFCYLNDTINGIAMDKDFIKGMELLHKAAELQHIEALTMLGDIYRHECPYISQKFFADNTVSKDKKRALDLYAKAVEISGNNVLYGLGLWDRMKIKRLLKKKSGRNA